MTTVVETPPDGAPAEPVQPAPAPAAPPAPPADTTDWKAEADRWKAQARKNEDRSKANHTELTQRDEVLRLIAEKVGVPFDGKPDPAVLTRRLEEQTTLARQRAVELAVFSSAAGKVDATALLDSRDFMSKASALDPDAADFRDRVAEIVAEASTQPRYQFQQGPGQPAPAAATQAPAAPPAASSGADFSGAPGGNRLWTQADLDKATRPGADPAILSKAINDGLLVNLGIGKPKQRHRR